MDYFNVVMDYFTESGNPSMPAKALMIVRKYKQLWDKSEKTFDAVDGENELFGIIDNCINELKAIF